MREVIEQALTVAESSPDVRDEEPFLIRLVALAQAHHKYQVVLEDNLIDLAARVGTTPHPMGSVELLSYALHVLQLPRLVAAIEEMRQMALAAGNVGRPWECARRYEQVLDAQQQEWTERELFPSLGT